MTSCRNCRTALTSREGRDDWCPECLAFDPMPPPPEGGTPEEMPSLIVWVPCPSCKTSPLLPLNEDEGHPRVGCPTCHHQYELKDVTKLTPG